MIFPRFTKPMHSHGDKNAVIIKDQPSTPSNDIVTALKKAMQNLLSS